MQKPTKPAVKGAATGAALMLAVASAFTPIWEGTETKPYYDTIGRVWTVCTGETNVPMREYSEAECKAMFGKSFMTYANDVKRLSPGIENSPYEWAAHSDLTYNIGAGPKVCPADPKKRRGYVCSSVSRLYNEGKPLSACRAMRLYNKGGGRVVQGLVNRREGKGEVPGSYELCAVGAVPKALGL